MLHRGQQVVGVHAAAAGGRDAVEVRRRLVLAGGQDGGLRGEVVVAVVGVVGGAVGRVGGRAVGVGLDRLRQPPQRVVALAGDDAARVGDRLHVAGGVVAVAG